MFLKLPKYNSSLAPGFTNKELKDQISRQRKNTRFKQQFEEFWEPQKTKTLRSRVLAQRRSMGSVNLH